MLMLVLMLLIVHKTNTAIAQNSSVKWQNQRVANTLNRWQQKHSSNKAFSVQPSVTGLVMPACSFGLQVPLFGRFAAAAAMIHSRSLARVHDYEDIEYNNQ